MQKIIKPIFGLFLLVMVYNCGRISKVREIEERYEVFAENYAGSDLYHVEKAWLFRGQKLDSYGYETSDEEWILE